MNICPQIQLVYIRTEFSDIDEMDNKSVAYARMLLEPLEFSHWKSR